MRADKQNKKYSETIVFFFQYYIKKYNEFGICTFILKLNFQQFLARNDSNDKKKKIMYEVQDWKIFIFFILKLNK